MHRSHFAPRHHSVLLCAAFALLAACHDEGATSTAPVPPPSAVAPSITTQPSDQSAVEGKPASFGVTAAGTAPLTYQWQRNAVSITGANATTYSIASAASADSGAKFSVVVSNSAGSVTSNDATLTVVAAAQTVSAASGGEVKSGDGFLTLNIPGGALTADATVTIASSSDWVAPQSLPSQFTVLAGTTHVISAQGGSFDPSRQFEVTVSTAGLNAPVAKAASRPSGKRSSQPQPTSTSTFEDLGLVADCGDGNPVIVMLPPSSAANDYDSGTFIAGCPAPGGGGVQVITLSLVTYTDDSQPTAPSGNVLWESATPYTPLQTADKTLCVSCDTATHGDTWMGSGVSTSIAMSSIPYYAAGTTLVSFVDDNGQPIARFVLPIAATAVVLDGPWNFYAALGRNETTGYVARYAMKYTGSGWQVGPPQWETTLTGAPATADGTSVDTNVTGTAFVVDSQSGDLVALAGNSGSSSDGKLTADDIARLGLDADGFVVRINRSGTLTAATAVVSSQPVVYGNTTLSAQRSEDYVLRVDHAGNAFVAATLCCQSSGPTGVSGLTLKKISNTGALVWESAVAGPDEVGSPGGLSAADYYGGYVGAIAVDAGNNAYLTYYHADPNPSNNGHLYTVKVAADTGDVSAVGYVDPTVDQSRYVLAYGADGSASYIDTNGNLYLYLEFLGFPSVARLVALDSSLNVVGTTALPDIRFNHGVQVDSSGNIYQQTTLYSAQAGTITPDLRKLHY